jgi:hypothetical protein
MVHSIIWFEKLINTQIVIINTFFPLAYAHTHFEAEFMLKDCKLSIFKRFLGVSIIFQFFSISCQKFIYIYMNKIFTRIIYFEK